MSMTLDELKDLKKLAMIIIEGKYNPQELFDSRDADYIIELVDAEIERQENMEVIEWTSDMYVKVLNKSNNE